jgi:hypothetical protein
MSKKKKEKKPYAVITGLHNGCSIDYGVYGMSRPDALDLISRTSVIDHDKLYINSMMSNEESKYIQKTFDL